MRLTTRPTNLDENIKDGAAHAGRVVLLVMVVVFVFLQGLSGHDHPMLAIPVSLVATFAVRRPSASRSNSLTLCGLILATGWWLTMRSSASRTSEKYLHRGLAPLEATRAAMAEITTPIVTNHPGAGRRVRPRGLHARHDRDAVQPVRDDDRLLVRFLGVSIRLSFSPAMARLFLRQKHGETGSFSSAGSRRAGLDRELLRCGARMDGPPLVDDRRAVAGPARPDRWMVASRPRRSSRPRTRAT